MVGYDIPEVTTLLCTGKKCTFKDSNYNIIAEEDNVDRVYIGDGGFSMFKAETNQFSVKTGATMHCKIGTEVSGKVVITCSKNTEKTTEF